MSSGRLQSEPAAERGSRGAVPRTWSWLALFGSVCFLGAALLRVFAPSWWPGATQSEAVGVFCTEPVHDFGHRRSTSHVQHAFVLENHGSAAVKLLAVTADCGCTRATCQQRVIPAGGNATVDVDLDLRGLRGRLTKRVYLTTDAPHATTVELRMTGEATPTIIAEPAELAIAPGASGTVRLSRWNTGFRIVRTEVKPGGYTCAATAVDPGFEYVVHVRSEAPDSPTSDPPRLYVYTDVAGEPVVSIPIVTDG